VLPSAEARLSPGADELVWAFKACEEGFRTDIDPARRSSLMDDYKFRRGRALRLEPRLASAARVHEFAVKSMLRKCDVELPRFTAELRKKQASTDVDDALAACRAAHASGNTADIEASYEKFKQLSQRARAADPALSKNKAVKEQLSTCEADLATLVKKRHDVEAAALARYREETNRKMAKPE
jgi:hypothetical protein